MYETIRVKRSAREQPEGTAPNMTLPDQNSSMVNTLCEAKFEYLCLQTALQEIFNFESEHVVKAHARLIKHTNPHKTTDECIAFEQTFWVLIIEFQQLTSCTTDF